MPRAVRYLFVQHDGEKAGFYGMSGKSMDIMW